MISPRQPSPLELSLIATDNEQLANSPALDDPNVARNEIEIELQNCPPS